MQEMVLAPPAIRDRFAVARPRSLAKRASTMPNTTLNPSVMLTEKAAHPAKCTRSEPVNLVKGSTATTPITPWAADIALAGGLSSRRDTNATVAAPSMPAINHPAGSLISEKATPSTAMIAAADTQRPNRVIMGITAPSHWRRTRRRPLRRRACERSR